MKFMRLFSALIFMMCASSFAAFGANITISPGSSVTLIPETSTTVTCEGKPAFLLCRCERTSVGGWNIWLKAKVQGEWEVLGSLPTHRDDCGYLMANHKECTNFAEPIGFN